MTAQADATGRAQPRREVRHVHLEQSPLAIAVVQMASEPFAIWGALVGTNRTKPQLLVAPEPRNADIAFLAMAEFAKVICDSVDKARDGSREELRRKDGSTYTRCESAPQLLVTNGAAVSFLDRLGRRMRPAGYGGHVEVPEWVNVAGAHLGFFAEMAHRPGSSLVVTATEALSRHWVTGQSAFEDDHLATQLAWHDPGLLNKVDPALLEGKDAATLTGAQAAERAETIPMGVLTDPDDDNGDLLEAVMEFNEKRRGKTDRKTVQRLGRRTGDLLRDGALNAMWSALWVAYDRLSSLPEGEHVEGRWADDRYQFTNHADYTQRGGRRRSVDSAKRAAMVLADWEDAQSDLEHDEFLDDRLARIDAIVAGRAVSGGVIKVDREQFDLNEKTNRKLRRPRIVLEAAGAFGMPIGTELWWAERPGKTGAIVEKVSVRGSRSRVTLKVTSGVTGELPAVGTEVLFSPYKSDWHSRPYLPADLPWTHVSPEEETSDRADIDETKSLDEVLTTGGAG